jgi:hypothetical protein
VCEVGSGIRNPALQKRRPPGERWTGGWERRGGFADDGVGLCEGLSICGCKADLTAEFDLDRWNVIIRRIVAAYIAENTYARIGLYQSAALGCLPSPDPEGASTT